MVKARQCSGAGQASGRGLFGSSTSCPGRSLAMCQGRSGRSLARTMRTDLEGGPHRTTALGTPFSRRRRDGNPHRARCAAAAVPPDRLRASAATGRCVCRLCASSASRHTAPECPGASGRYPPARAAVRPRSGTVPAGATEGRRRGAHDREAESGAARRLPRRPRPMGGAPAREVSAAAPSGDPRGAGAAMGAVAAGPSTGCVRVGPVGLCAGAFGAGARGGWALRTHGEAGEDAVGAGPARAA